VLGDNFGAVKLIMRILIFGNISGVNRLMKLIPSKNIIGVVGAIIRPQYHHQIQSAVSKLGIPFNIQPRFDSSEYVVFQEWVLAQRPDLIWVDAYPMKLQDDILSIARLGGINIHYALLPKYRGSNPIQWAILNNEHEVGVTLHEMTNNFDQGNIISQKKIPLYKDDTWIDADHCLAVAAEKIVSEVLPDILAGEWSSEIQNESLASCFNRRTSKDGEINWSWSVNKIHNLIRALVKPHPGAFFYNSDKDKIVIDYYCTLFEVTSLKYGEIRKEGLKSTKTDLFPLARDDRECYYRWSNGKELVKFDRSFHPVCDITDEEWFEHITKQSNLVIFKIRKNGSNNAIGFCGLGNINWIHGSAELQIVVGDKEHFSLGFASEAVNLLLEFGYNDLILNRIYLHVFTDNPKAIKCFRKAGFKNEGTLRQAAYVDGQHRDVFIMSMLKKNYDNRNSST
jgi:methionyl-tRNA formyltransferase